MTDFQFERMCTVLTWLLVLAGVAVVTVTGIALRSRSALTAAKCTRHDPAVLEAAAEDYHFHRSIAIALWVVFVGALVFRLWAYIGRGV